jgi:hypothetical protein
MKYLAFGSLILFIQMCTSLKSNGQQSLSYESYEKEIQDWDQKRNAALKQQDGWLNLAGLFWLEKGENCFGSNPKAKLNFVHPTMPNILGCFIWKEQKIDWMPQSGIIMKEANGHPFQNGKIFDLDSAQGTTLQWGQFLFTIIKREEKIGLRFRDLKSPNLLSFKGNPRFPADTQWKLKASFLPSYGKKIPITNVLGQTSLLPSPGKIVFNFKGETYKLDAIDEGGSELFIIFGDATSGIDTYPAGRFMYIPKPDANNQTLIDFNKAFNPPCAYTDFATCPLPPQQNILNLEIKAGEKTIHH